MNRPSTLAAVVEGARTTQDFHYALAEFLDQFALERRLEMLVAEPPRIEAELPAGVADAYLAAVAVTLARTIEADPPAWVWKASRKLRRPWFAHPGAALRATLLQESPAPFRERNLFVSANALSRA